jgi:hypothetical protein
MSVVFFPLCNRLLLFYRLFTPYSTRALCIALRAHQGLNDMVPDEVYKSFQHEKQEELAA